MAIQTRATYAALTNQSLARPLTEAEMALAAALESIYSGGMHDFAAVAAELQRTRIARPSGSHDAWTAENLKTELAALNASLDACYARDGIGA